MRQSIKSLCYFIAIISALLTSCNFSSEKKNQVLKFSPNDPFQESMPKSQFFEIDSKIDNVAEGENGTVLAIPKGAFLDENGKEVEEMVKVELAEALSLEDMILSNLTTTSDGKLLETGGMLYLNATSNGHTLKINPANPIYIEIPTQKRKTGMMVYKGERDEKGNMNWFDPQPLKNFLIPVDIDLLNFYPEGFEEEVQKGMPFRKHRIATKRLTDSLYYSLSAGNPGDLVQGLNPTDYNEPYYNKNKRVINGKYTAASYLTQLLEHDEHFSDSTPSECGIDPASIKVLKNKKFENSFIATREFETRLKEIFKACDPAVLTIYVTNLEKDLWICDSLAAIQLSGTTWEETFKNFASEKLTSVKNAGKYAELLKSFYDKKLKQYKNELERIHSKAMNLLEKQNQEAEKVATEYKEVLWKREKHRMEAYGFLWTETGWLNVDKPGPATKVWGRKRCEVVIENGKEFDNIYTYFTFPVIQSLYRLNSTDKVVFYPGNEDERSMLMPKDKESICISIGYKSDSSYLAIQKFIPAQTEKISLQLMAVSKQKLKEAIRAYDKYKAENRIDVDLKFMEFFAKEKKRQEQLKKEAEFMQNLYDVAFGCCELNGEELFKGACAICHSPYLDKKVGPGLGNATQKYDSEYLYRFTINSSKLIPVDERAAKVFREYNGMQMPNHDLTQKQVEAIFNYIDGLTQVEQANQ